MEYKEGYVAFLDILGFSSFVKDENNIEIASGLFDFINKFRYLYNTSNLEVEAEFFSDSFVLVADDWFHLILPITVLEGYLKEHLGLILRGGISFGKYYHEQNVIFGPAIVEAYQLELKAQYSRIIIHESIEVEQNFCIYPDYDGCRCLNPDALLIRAKIDIDKDIPAREDFDFKEKIVSSFSERREELIKQINKYANTAHIEKYIWRVRPFNYTCHFFSLTDERIFSELPVQFENEIKKEISKQIITDEEVYELLRNV